MVGEYNELDRKGSKLKRSARGNPGSSTAKIARAKTGREIADALEIHSHFEWINKNTQGGVR